MDSEECLSRTAVWWGRQRAWL